MVTILEQPRPGASELMRSLGMSVDGPAQWGKPVYSRLPGLFVVELPGGRSEAPLDTVALRRWVEHVPDLRLDGEITTAQDLSRRLARYWLADEPILYVGRSARAIGPRVGAMYATPLGDARPYAGGHWLKTLAVLSGLRVWWSETDAHEEYEDALLAAVAARSGGRPFANTGRSALAGEHGLTNALREPAEEKAAAAPIASRRPRSPAGPRTAGGAGRSLKPAAGRAPPEATFISAEGLERLSAELEDLRLNVRPAVIARVKTARELGDLKENADYEYARKEQSFVEGRIQTLEALVKSSVVIDAARERSESATLGSTVVVDMDGEQMKFVIVGSTEADPAKGQISNVSPVGRALLGARTGDTVVAQLPNGTATFVVREVR